MDPTKEQLKARIDATGQQPVPQTSPTLPPTTPQLSTLQTPVPASSLTPSQTFDLPQPQAPTIQQEYVTSVTQDVQNARNALEADYKSRQERADKELERLRGEEKQITDKQQELTQPFREQLETAERERLFINENFQANQRLVGELESLVGEANARLTGEVNRFASRSSIQAGYTRTLNDITARSGLIQSVMAARNGQIAQAYTMIDRSVAAIAADRNDELRFYDALLTLNNQKQLKLDTESKKIVDEKTALLKGDLSKLEKTAQSIKDAMIDPDTALAYAEAGVTLLDTPEQINKKLADYQYVKETRDLSNQMALKGFSSIPSGTKAPGDAPTVTITDSRGVKRSYYLQPTPLSPKEIQQQQDAQRMARETVTTVQDKIDDISNLLTHSGMKGTVGAYGIARWTPLSPDKADKQAFIGKVQQLISRETLDTLINLKAAGGTLGALSDQERVMLQNAASAIGFWAIEKDGKVVGYEIDEASFKAELETIQTLAIRARDRALGDSGLVLPTEVAAIDALRNAMTTSTGASIKGKESLYFSN